MEHFRLKSTKFNSTEQKRGNWVTIEQKHDNWTLSLFKSFKNSNFA